MSREIKLSVNNLKISFRTDAGKVQAVRDISFDLYKGETLAIVGESGSGKSVTSKAIMGISAVNSIHENGEILYDGQDLMQISEEDMHKLRGDKIAMIFQDPLSSLNPIMRIGKQITEAMLLKNKANRKEGRVVFNNLLKVMADTMKDALEAQSNTTYSPADVNSFVKTFDKFNIKSIELDNSYSAARTAAEELVAISEDFLFLTEKNQKVDIDATLKLINRKLKDVSNDKYFRHGYDEKLTQLFADLKAVRHAEKSKVSVLDSVKKVVTMSTLRRQASEETARVVTEIRDLVNEMLAQPEYNFFRIGYYMIKHPEADLSTMPADEANELAYNFLNEDFMNEFISLEKIAIQYSAEKSLRNKENAITDLQAALEFFNNGNFTSSEAESICKRLSKTVSLAIDPLAVVKDNVAYTFEHSLTREVEKYFFHLENNKKEEERFARQTAKREAQIARGKQVEWKVVPKSVADLDKQLADIISVINRAINKFKSDIENKDSVDFDKRCIEVIDFLKSKASQVVYKLTKRIAKEKAVKLMEEVGIPEPRIRYRQYPFEFSGGMRQRIVIAIALAANPDILICDEPTTALDVTIQAQILELINKLKRERNLSVIFITHDLGVVANMADRIAVMYAGKIVEYGTANDIFYDPQHPYTWALLSSMPDLDTNEKLDAIPGTPPNMIYPPVGDAFAARNKYALEIDFEMQPPMFQVSDTHYAATWLLHPNAPKVELPKIISERIARMKAAQGGNEDA